MGDTAWLVRLCSAGQARKRHCGLGSTEGKGEERASPSRHGRYHRPRPFPRPLPRRSRPLPPPSTAVKASPPPPPPPLPGCPPTLVHCHLALASTTSASLPLPARPPPPRVRLCLVAPWPVQGRDRPRCLRRTRNRCEGHWRGWSEVRPYKGGEAARGS